MVLGQWPGQWFGDWFGRVRQPAQGGGGPEREDEEEWLEARAAAAAARYKTELEVQVILDAGIPASPRRAEPTPVPVARADDAVAVLLAVLLMEDV